MTYPGTKTVNYEYDLNSNRAKLIYPDSSYITYEYDQLNRLTAIKDQAAQASAAIPGTRYLIPTDVLIKRKREQVN